LSSELKEALRIAAERIQRFHARQAERLEGFEYSEQGVTLASRVTPLSRVGIYAPGGKARYPSSVLMTAVVARVAGVRDIIVATPDPGPEVRAACHLAGVTGLLDAGGAQAIAALAYGTASVPRVDKIVGPGNLYVTAAKRAVFGNVDIDSLAGPSEILVIADDTADPRLIAADLLSQAEHDEAAYPLLLTSDAGLVSRVQVELERQLNGLPRRQIAEACLAQNGVALVVSNRDRLSEVASRLAAEHVAVHTLEPRELADRIVRAGAIFVGPMTPEAAGDYLAGPSHVLPTGGAARFGAPLGVYDFLARTSLIAYEREALATQARHIVALAESEGLGAHAKAVQARLTPDSGRP
jgi:histidinol dehydrogenase